MWDLQILNRDLIRVKIEQQLFAGVAKIAAHVSRKTFTAKNKFHQLFGLFNLLHFQVKFSAALSELSSNCPEKNFEHRSFFDKIQVLSKLWQLIWGSGEKSFFSAKDFLLQNLMTERRKNFRWLWNCEPGRPVSGSVRLCAEQFETRMLPTLKKHFWQSFSTETLTENFKPVVLETYKFQNHFNSNFTWPN